MSEDQNPYEKKDNYEAWMAWECIVRTNVNIFLTGLAGTGKTTFLKSLLSSCPKVAAVVAPTGVAAINAGGMTIHSFFQLAPTLYNPNMSGDLSKNVRQERIDVMKNLNLLIIDEISMVRPDVLDAVDARLRYFRDNELPFGGVQLLFIGDLMQLPPVVKEDERKIFHNFYKSSFFFASHALAKTKYYIIELKQIYRQSDPGFIDLLNHVRNDSLTLRELQLLNTRYEASFNPPDSEHYIRLATHNASASSVNKMMLEYIKSKPRTYTAVIEGKFPPNGCIAEKELTLKKGAQVMFIKNDPGGLYYNGKIGRVASLDNNSVTVSCEDLDEPVKVTARRWESYSYTLDPETKRVVKTVDGYFEQIPLVLAWAVTIHKSQGLTFNKVIVDAANSFAHGQVYVALSRCRTFRGLVLSSKISKSCIYVDDDVKSYLAHKDNKQIFQEQIDLFSDEYTMSVLEDVFNFKQLLEHIIYVQGPLLGCKSKKYQAVAEDIEQTLHLVHKRIIRHADTFVSICRDKMKQGVNIEEDDNIAARISAGAKYFYNEVYCLFGHIFRISDLTLDNKAKNDKYLKRRAMFISELDVKMSLFYWLTNNRFSTTGILREKSEIEASYFKQGEEPSSPFDYSKILNTDIYESLQEWRIGLTPVGFEFYLYDLQKIMSDKLLMEIAEVRPTTKKELAAIYYMGDIRAREFGDEILDVISTCTQNPKHKL